jgi:hypothetical protein
MQARIVEARRGAYWLAEGWLLFRAAPVGWIVTVFIYVLLTQLPALMPIVGIAGLVAVPAFTVGLMSAARAVSRGGKLELQLLFDGFRGDLRRQILLGTAYAALMMLAVIALRLADDDGVLRSVFAGDRKADEVSLGELLAPLAVFALIYAPVTMMFWFAPPLVAWHSTAVLKAMFFSFVACLMNWRAFLIYGLAISAMMVLLPLIVLNVIALASGSTSKTALVFFALTFFIMFLPPLFASVYVSYRDIFGVEKNP